MHIRNSAAFLPMILIVSLAFLPLISRVDALQASDTIRIRGLVDNPLNLTRVQLNSLPTVSEVARLVCVVGVPDAVYNWTGIPLFHLLTLAQVRTEAFKVVTRGSGGFESDLPMKEAMQPTTIIALGANGTDVPDINGVTGYRLVVPGKWGYKWVGGVEEIEVVDYDYKGTYESTGIWSDQADIPDFESLPALVPPLQVFPLSYGNRTFETYAFSNASFKSFNFDYFQKKIEANVTVSSGTTSFVDFILQQAFLKGPYNVTLDGNRINTIEVGTNQLSYLYFSIGLGGHTIEIVGTQFFGQIPRIEVTYNNAVLVRQDVIFNASKSADYGQIVAFEWNFGDGTKGTGPVVSHSYNDTGVFEVTLNVTDSQGISNISTLPVTVQSPPLVMPFSGKLFLAAIGGLLVVIFIVLLKKRRSLTIVRSASVEKAVSAELTPENIG
jgi:hypothetical protein